MKKNIVLIFVLCLGNVIFAQTQIGADINGEAASDNFGFDSAISSNGNTIAVGATLNDGNGADAGHVRVFNLSGSVWTQVGSDINGNAADDRCGSSVALNSTGTIVAVGSPRFSTNNIGRVRIFNLVGGVWTQIGANIDGIGNNANAGFSVALSSSGNIVAIGSPNYSTGATNRGLVQVYQNISGTWTLLGGNILGSAVENRLGSKVAISSDGSILAVSAPGNGAFGAPGYVRVFQNISGTWTPIGSDIIGAANGDGFGEGLSLSSNGNVVAIGAPYNSANGTLAGHVRVYQNNSGTWQKIGADILGETSQSYFGSRLSISGDGTVVAIGAPANSNSNGSFAGHVKVYRNNSNTWQQIGSNINGEAASDASGSSVAIASDASKVVIGAPSNDGNGSDSGQVRVYNLSPLLSRNDIDSKLVFAMYPNPTKDSITIDLEKELKSVEVYSLQGQKVLSANAKQMNVSGLSNGIYMVRVEDTEGAVATQKLIKN